VGKQKKYDEIKQFILNKINSGVLVSGDKVSTEAELMEIFSVSRNPVRKALSNLAAEGYVKKIHGSGSYIQEKALFEEINIYVIMFYNRYLESQIIQGMRKAVDNCFYKNINLILKRPGRSTSEYIEVLKSIEYRDKCGVLCIPLIDRNISLNKLLESSLRKLERSTIPLVQVDQFVPGYSGSCIMSDHSRGAADMFRLILEQGHRSVAIFHETNILPSLKLRIDGIEQVIEDSSGMSVNLTYFPVDPDDVENNGEQILTKLKKDKVTALFCLNSELTFQIHRLLSDTGLKIPEDLSLCSFDDHSFLVAGKENNITSVIQNFENIGYYSVNILLDQILGRTSGQVKMLLKPEIIQRRSLGTISPISSL
jgi:GntR family transcriptional regulator, arabinose operon transcriptional repressor